MEPTPASAVGSARLEDIRDRVDAALDRFLAGRRAALAEADPAAAGLVDELVRVIGAGGKRLRPLFCYWGYRAAGGADGDEIVATAASLELLHTFAIIHDDVMDRSPRRRGLPATHVALARAGDAHSGVAAAILAGDLAVVLSDELFCEAGFPAERFLAGFRWYNRMRSEVVAGQYLDLLGSHAPFPDEARVLRIARLKSGGYTVEKPLLIGSALAAGAPEVETVLSAFGSTLGEAFQLRDDVLGLFGDPEMTGKDVDGDLREGKRTLLIARATAAASDEDRGFIEANLGRPDLDPEDAERIRQIVRDSGALASTLETIERSRASAIATLGDAALDPAVSAALMELADLAAVRES
jgi:geranylgeranyl diphosphate synthase, type I